MQRIKIPFDCLLSFSSSQQYNQTPLGPTTQEFGGRRFRHWQQQSCPLNINGTNTFAIGTAHSKTSGTHSITTCRHRFDWSRLHCVGAVPGCEQSIAGLIGNVLRFESARAKPKLQVTINTASRCLPYGTACIAFNCNRTTGCIHHDHGPWSGPI